MGFRPRVRAVGPAGSAYALAASHEAMSARPNAAAWWPLKDVCEHLRPSGSYTGLHARTVTRPPHNGSFRIHLSLGTLGIAHETGKLHFFLKCFLENEIFLDNIKYFVLIFSNIDCIYLEKAISIFLSRR